MNDGVKKMNNCYISDVLCKIPAMLATCCLGSAHSLSSLFHSWSWCWILSPVGGHNWLFPGTAVVVFRDSNFVLFMKWFHHLFVLRDTLFQHVYMYACTVLSLRSIKLSNTPSLNSCFSARYKLKLVNTPGVWWFVSAFSWFLFCNECECDN